MAVRLRESDGAPHRDPQHRAHARVLGELSRRMEAEREVSVLEHGCLFELSSAPQRTTRMAVQADRLGISPSSLTRLVDRLEERGWVQRELPRENRRTIEVVITADGLRAYMQNNRPFVQAVDELIAARLSDGQMQELIGLLERLRS